MFPLNLFGNPDERAEIFKDTPVRDVSWSMRRYYPEIEAGKSPYAIAVESIREQKAERRKKFKLHEPRTLYKKEFQNFTISIPLRGGSSGIVFFRIEF